MPATRYRYEDLDHDATQELLSCPARHLPELPLEVRIHAQVPGFSDLLIIDSRSGARPEGALHLTGDELVALSLGVEAERLWPGDFKGFCLHKHQSPDFRITLGDTLAGAQPVACRARTLRDVLAQLEVEVIQAEIALPVGDSDDAAPRGGTDETITRAA